MKNEKEEIGGWFIIVPAKVVKLGLVLDKYKQPTLPQLWKEAEARAKACMRGFAAEDLFHEELAPGQDAEILYSFRYYTPVENRRRVHQKDTPNGHHH